ncbi:unnamed protein product [Durusdinium trenchii]|uniref:Uncharacterized protein n=1 Tax=Durusdinium trenchii TaxID=1381693 RepID=A0ABP0IU26_9DINO
MRHRFEGDLDIPSDQVLEPPRSGDTLKQVVALLLWRNTNESLGKKKHVSSEQRPFVAKPCPKFHAFESLLAAFGLPVCDWCKPLGLTDLGRQGDTFARGR